MPRRSRRLLLAAALAALALAAGAFQPARAQSAPARVLVTADIDAHELVRLSGNTRPEARTARDLGRVPDSMPLEHMLLLLKRPAERELALGRYIGQLHDRRSPLFHRWLSAAQLGERYGVAGADLATIGAWLRQQGFTVNRVYPSTVMIDFSGTAGAVRGAFHTEIHALAVRGARHTANTSDPEIPAALAPLVAGIVTLHDFRPHPTLHRAHPGYTLGSAHLVVPADLATIYNLNPLFAAGTTGQGQTVVVIEDTYVYDTANWSTFRSVFGLSGYSSGSFTEVQPGGAETCGAPGVNGDQAEAILDAEWASAAAPGAAIELAACADTSTTFGGLLALENLVNASSPPPIVSISYAECEADNGLTANAAFASTYQQAASEGMSVFVAAGDWGAAVCDADSGVAYATQGIAVNGLASTPYNVAVGGTDFGDAYAGTTSTYWSSSNSSVYGSALSYIPEIPWDESCASSLIAAYEGYSTTYGSSGFCNSSKATTPVNFIDFIAGSGGPSSCAIAASGGGCAGTPKPSWQSAPGVPADGVRDLPDVSLFASDGPWGHAYVFCDSDGSTCSSGSSPSSWAVAGGTSFATPILAGIQALVNQSTGARQGNPNTVYYTLASSQSASGLGCNSTSGNGVSSGCVFYDVTQGNMDVVCEGTDNCYLPSGTYGVLSTSDSAYAPAYGAATGWDFATGLGSVNASNLVKYWTSSDISLRASGTVTAGGQLSYSLQVGNHGPQAATGVVVTTVLPAGLTLIAGMSSAGCTQSGQTVTCTVGSLAVGSVSSITVVVQPGPPGTVTLAFTASSANADLDPADGSADVALNWSGTGESGGDGPLPLWAYAALALLLILIAARRPAMRVASSAPARRL